MLIQVLCQEHEGCNWSRLPWFRSMHVGPVRPSTDHATLLSQIGLLAGDMPLGFLARELPCTEAEWVSYVRQDSSALPVQI